MMHDTDKTFELLTDDDNIDTMSNKEIFFIKQNVHNNSLTLAIYNGDKERFISVLRYHSEN